MASSASHIKAMPNDLCGGNFTVVSGLYLLTMTWPTWTISSSVISSLVHSVSATRQTDALQIYMCY